MQDPTVSCRPSVLALLSRMSRSMSQGLLCHFASVGWQAAGRLRHQHDRGRAVSFTRRQATFAAHSINTSTSHAAPLVGRSTETVYSWRLGNMRIINARYGHDLLWMLGGFAHQPSAAATRVVAPNKQPDNLKFIWPSTQRRLFSQKFAFDLHFSNLHIFCFLLLFRFLLTTQFPAFNCFSFVWMASIWAQSFTFTDYNPRNWI